MTLFTLCIAHGELHTPSGYNPHSCWIFCPPTLSQTGKVMALFFPWAVLFSPWPLLRFLLTQLPRSWLCSRHHGQELSFLRACYSLSLPLGTLCAWILRIWLLLKLRLSLTVSQGELTILIESSSPFPLPPHHILGLIFFVVLIIVYENLSSKVWYLPGLVYCPIPFCWQINISWSGIRSAFFSIINQYFLAHLAQ